MFMSKPAASRTVIAAEHHLLDPTIVPKVLGIASHPRSASGGTSAAIRLADSLQGGLPRLFATFVDGEFFVQARDHLPNAGLGEALRANRVTPLQPLQSVFEHAEF